MKRTLRTLALSTALGCSLSASAQAPPAAATPPLEQRVGRTITIRTADRAAEKCLVLKAWKLADNHNAMEAVAIETGEKVTIVENVKAANAADMFRVFRWGKSTTAPAGCPLPPNIVVAKNDPPTAMPVQPPKPLEHAKPVQPPNIIDPPKPIELPRPVEPAKPAVDKDMKDWPAAHLPAAKDGSNDVKPVAAPPKEFPSSHDLKPPAIDPARPKVSAPAMSKEPDKLDTSKPPVKLPPPEVVGGTINLYDANGKPIECQILSMFTPTGGGKGMHVKVLATGETWTILERPDASGQGIILEVIREEKTPPQVVKNEPNVKPMEPPPVIGHEVGEILVFYDSKNQPISCRVIQHFTSKEGHPGIYAKIIETGEMVTIIESPQSGSVGKVWTVKPNKAPPYMTSPGKPPVVQVKNDPSKPDKLPPADPPKDPNWRETWGPAGPKNPKPVEPPVVVKDEPKPIKIDVGEPKDPKKPVEPPKKPVEVVKNDPVKKPVEPPKPSDPPKKPVAPSKPPVEVVKNDPVKKPVEPPKPSDPPKKPVDPPKPPAAEKPKETTVPPLGPDRPVPVPGVPLHTTGPRPEVPPPQPPIRPFNSQMAPEYDPREPNRVIPASLRQSPNPYDYPPRTGPVVAGPVSPTLWSRGPVVPTAHTEGMVGMEKTPQGEMLRNIVFIWTVLQSSGDAEQREWAAKKLRAVDPAANPYVVDSLVNAARTDPSAMVRAAAVQSLAEMGANQATVQSVIDHAKQDRDPRVRDEAFQAEERMKTNHGDVVPALHKTRR